MVFWTEVSVLLLVLHGVQATARYRTTTMSPGDNFKMCNNPLTDSRGPVFCGRGGQRCPPGYYCQSHPADKGAVCCPVQSTIPVTTPGCQRRLARCVFEASSGDPDVPVHGCVLLAQEGPRKPVYISAALSGFNSREGNSRHGFHIHEEGDLGNKCADAGGHYRKPSQTHGAPTDPRRHFGDLGNIETNQIGMVTHSAVDSRISLFEEDGPECVLGRAIVVHAGEDDLGLGGDAGSAATGNAGKRLACCTITPVSDP